MCGFFSPRDAIDHVVIGIVNFFSRQNQNERSLRKLLMSSNTNGPNRGASTNEHHQCLWRRLFVYFGGDVCLLFEVVVEVGCLFTLYKQSRSGRTLETL